MVGKGLNVLRGSGTAGKMEMFESQPQPWEKLPRHDTALEIVCVDGKIANLLK